MEPEQLAARFARARLDKERLMSRIVLTVEANSKRVTPVDTGTLRRSITSEVQASGERGVIGTNVDYALYVHEGTKYMEGRPFLTQGLAASRDTINQYLDDAGYDLLREIAG